MKTSQPIFTEQQPAPPLTFNFLRQQNVARCDESFQMHGGLEGWSVPHWTMAITGELGELCNKLKKIERGETIPIAEIAHEADRVNSKRYL